jgi:hypothetical protein
MEVVGGAYALRIPLSYFPQDVSTPNLFNLTQLDSFETNSGNST